VSSFSAYSLQNGHRTTSNGRVRVCVQLGRLATDGFDYVIVGVERKLRHNDETAGATGNASAAAT